MTSRFVTINPLKLRDRHKAAEVLATFQHLLALDDVWTQYLQQAKRIPRTDMKSLRVLTVEMRRLLRDCRSAARSLYAIVHGQRRWFDTGWKEMLSEIPLSEGKKSHIQERIQKADFAAFSGARTAKGRTGSQRKARTITSFSSLVEAATAVLITHSSRAESEISAKMRLITSKGYAPGDLPKVVKCAALGGIMGAAAATGNVLAFVGAVIAADNTTCFSTGEDDDEGPGPDGTGGGEGSGGGEGGAGGGGD